MKRRTDRRRRASSSRRMEKSNGKSPFKSSRQDLRRNEEQVETRENNNLSSTCVQPRPRRLFERGAKKSFLSLEIKLNGGSFCLCSDKRSGSSCSSGLPQCFIRLITPDSSLLRTQFSPNRGGARIRKSPSGTRGTPSTGLEPELAFPAKISIPLAQSNHVRNEVPQLKTPGPSRLRVNRNRRFRD